MVDVNSRPATLTVSQSPRTANERKTNTTYGLVQQTDAVLEIKAETEREATLGIWKSCCFHVRRDGCVFTARLVISLYVLTFSFYFIIENPTPERIAVGTTLIGTVLGYWIGTKL